MKTRMRTSRTKAGVLMMGKSQTIRLPVMSNNQWCPSTQFIQNMRLYPHKAIFSLCATKLDSGTNKQSHSYMNDKMTKYLQLHNNEDIQAHLINTLKVHCTIFYSQDAR